MTEMYGGKPIKRKVVVEYPAERGADLAKALAWEAVKREVLRKVECGEVVGLDPRNLPLAEGRFTNPYVDREEVIEIIDVDPMPGHLPPLD
jgi:hypothetical protein